MGLYGFGWRIEYPAITRRTDQGLPLYRDALESDVFMLSGHEDLVPALQPDGTRVSAIRDGYRVDGYRPRIEGAFARIERWTNTADETDVFWRSISRDNATSWYGRTSGSRIADPDDPRRIFTWLLCESTDAFGNASSYDYVAEDSRGIESARAHEQTRTAVSRSANRYLKRARYGNTISRLQPDFAATNWLFELVMDYGDHPGDQPSLDPTADWVVRPDPFSSYRGGFEVRTYRRCHRVLMFHRFAELGPAPRLVRSLTLDYDDLPDETTVDTASRLAHAGSTALGSFLRRATVTGYADNGVSRSLPPLELSYSRPLVSDEVRAVEHPRDTGLPVGVDGRQYRWIDFFSEGLSGVLSEQGGAWWYAPNLGDGRLGARAQMAEQPAGLSTNAQFLDLAGDGLLDLVDLERPAAGYFERTADDHWAAFRPFAAHPSLNWSDANLRLVDLTGDGHADVLIAEDDVFAWHPSLGEEGFGPREATRMAGDEARGPRLVFGDPSGTVFLADMSGDGLSDLVRVKNGEVCYWPNLGYGRFGRRVTMDGAPTFDTPERFDPRRLRLADIDGSGVTDLVYLASDGVRLYFNASGNGWTPAQTLHGFPAIDNDVDVSVVDLLGNGTACLVWSSPHPRDTGAPLRFVDLMSGQKPHLLTAIVNNLGAETQIGYESSTRFYLEDRAAGRPWITRLPFPVHVVTTVETRDHISRNRFVTRYAYHHGYFDGVEREFRGFGMVEQRDTETFAALAGNEDAPPADNIDAASHVPPMLTRTWFHTGVHLGRDQVAAHFAGLVDTADTGEYRREPGASDDDARARLLDDTVLPESLTVDEEREACRALKGSTLRQEIFALDDSVQGAHPYMVVEQNYTVRLEQPRSGNRHAVFFTHAREALTYQVRAQSCRSAYRPQHDDRRRCVRQRTALGIDRVRAPSTGSVAGARRSAGAGRRPGDCCGSEVHQRDRRVRRSSGAARLRGSPLRDHGADRGAGSRPLFHRRSPASHLDGRGDRVRAGAESGDHAEAADRAPAHAVSTR